VEIAEIFLVDGKRRKMTDFKEIYQTRAVDYDLMVTREDYEGNIIKALYDICEFSGKDVVEFGAGTGRLTRMVAPFVRSIVATDIAQHMLGITMKSLQQFSSADWMVAVADNRQMPFKSRIADVTMAGWSLGHSVGWYPNSWREEIRRAVGEMLRLLRPSGTAIIFETMGTGSEVPQPPTEGLARYYEWLEKEYGFSTRSIRTDYRFESIDEADRLTRFFFGDEMADRIRRDNMRRDNLVILPECTGIWWLKI
jgi:ubiquinone/menaquinone biosynthesis C-methylase UbiE